MIEYILDVLDYLENKAADITDILDDRQPEKTFLKWLFTNITYALNDLWWRLWKHW